MIELIPLKPGHLSKKVTGLKARRISREFDSGCESNTRGRGVFQSACRTEAALKVEFHSEADSELRAAGSYSDDCVSDLGTKFLPMSDMSDVKDIKEFVGE